MPDFDLEFSESRSLGATWALDVLWSRLGIGQTMRRALADRDLDESAERVLFALVANRALAPSPKLAARWVSEDVTISGLPATSDDAMLPPSTAATIIDVCAIDRLTVLPRYSRAAAMMPTSTPYSRPPMPAMNNKKRPYDAGESRFNMLGDSIPKLYVV